MATVTPVDGQTHTAFISAPPVSAQSCDACSGDTFVAGEAQVHVPAKLTVTGISPGRGLIGATTSSVTISGTGLSGATVTAPTGITPTVRSTASTSLVVDLAVSTSATAGNNTLTVHSSGSPPQTAATTFFVQVPTTISVLSVTTIANGSTGGCAVGAYGISVAVTYQVADQASPAQPIASSSMEPQELITNYVVNGVQQSTSPNWGDIGPSSVPGTSRVTASTGQYLDAPVSICNGVAFTGSLQQSVSVLVGATRYPVGSQTLRTQTLSYTGPSPNHGSISNGSDIQKSQ